MSTWIEQPFGIRVMDEKGKQWYRLRPDSEMSAEAIGAWLAGVRAGLQTFLGAVPKENRPVFQIVVDPTWEVTDVEEITDIFEYEKAFSDVFNAY